MNSRLSGAISEFSKGQWAAEELKPPPHAANPNLVARVWSWLSRLSPLTFARYGIMFFVGVVATVVWQSYRDRPKEEVVTASMRQSIDKLAAEITKLRAAEQDILDRMSAPPRPVASQTRSPPITRPPQAPSR